MLKWQSTKSPLTLFLSFRIPKWEELLKKKTTNSPAFSRERKCSASIDVINVGNRISRLSFGDLDKPETDVEVDFTYEQLLELRNVTQKAVKDMEAVIEEQAKKLERESPKKHYGSC